METTSVTMVTNVTSPNVTTLDIVNRTTIHPHILYFQSFCKNISETGVIPGMSVASRDHTERTLKQIVIPVMCVFGIFGNILNLLVLSQKRNRMDRMEKAANVGLIALAVSDMLFCVSVLPHAWVERTVGLHLMNFDLMYDIYSNAVINTFILCSTWLTVTMATSRYLAICHPLRAREIIGMTFAKSSMLVVFVLCILCNLPRYFYRNYKPESECPQGFAIYVIFWNGLVKRGSNFYKGYTVTYAILSLVIPLCLLTYCNIRLIRALRQSSRMRQQFRTRRQQPESTSHVITLTLIGIIVMYTILVAPNEILLFIRDFVPGEKPWLAMPMLVMNLAQVINFAAHFVLYCVINVHFRRTIVHWFCRCVCRREGPAVKDIESCKYAISHTVGGIGIILTFHMHKPF